MSRRALAAMFALALAGALGASAASAGTVQVTILSKKLWAKTGIEVHAGDVVTIKATGSWTWGGDSRVGPDGDPIDDYNAFDLFQPFDFFSQARVIAYIGKYPLQKRWGDPSFFPQQSGYFSIGSGQTIVAPYDGPLWVGMNDAAVTQSKADNKGQMLVTITTGNPGTGGPSIAIASPSGTYAVNQPVTTQFACTSGEATVQQCSANEAASGGPVDTSVPGHFAMTVLASDSNGNYSSKTVGYVVADASSAAVTPTGGVFPPTYMGSRSLVQQFVLANPQSSPITISSITTQGAFTAGNNCGTTLNPHKTCHINVTFQPDTVGTDRGELDVAASVAVVPVPLWGIGTQVHETPGGLVFADQGVGTTSAPMTITLENDQPTAMGIAQIVASGDFALDPSTTCPSNGHMIKSGKSCTIAVTFAPSATGARTGSLVVHGGTAIDPVTVSLSGNGT
ncbi:MAG TPA: choice-of-anchor D domain-containing protein [Rhizomicrobium sp.]|nr:choice-of-anchor D domain-containing protein [Rhizomicrobium sp.]